MSYKQHLSNLPQQFFEDLQNGITYREMMEEYNLTRASARSIPDIYHDVIVEEEIDGAGTKLWSTTSAVAPRDDYVNVKKQVQETSSEAVRRNSSETKQTITRKANDFLAKLERKVKDNEYDKPEINYDNIPARGGRTFIMHETDSHFGDKVTAPNGETTYSTDIAANKTESVTEYYLYNMDNYSVGEMVLLLGGDLLTGEGIYDGQAHEIDKTLRGQFEAATDSYYQMIKTLSSAYNVPFKIVCVSGNHGNLKISGSSPEANADDILYSTLERLVSIDPDIDNVKFVRSDYADHTTFKYCNGKWTGYLTHGENRMEHIGTSSPQSDWLAIKDRYDFDAAWRGHYHMQKQEEVNGAPVFMTNSRKPGDEYTDSIAAYGDTGSAIYVASEQQPVEEVKLIDL